MPEFFDLWSAGAKKTVSAALGNDLVIMSAAGVLYGAAGWYNGSSTVYVCIFDNASLPGNANPSVPFPSLIAQITGPGHFAIDLPPTGLYMANGAVIAISTTAIPNFTVDTSSGTQFIGMWAPIFGV